MSIIEVTVSNKDNWADIKQSVINPKNLMELKSSLIVSQITFCMIAMTKVRSML